MDTGKLKNSVSMAAIVVASGLAASAFAPKANAADLGSYKPAAPALMAPVNNWQGFHIGAAVGAAQPNYGGCFQCKDNNEYVPMEDLSETGVLGGLYAGYDWQFGTTVLGVEGEINFLDLESDARAISSSEEATSEFDSIGSVRARLGTLIGAEQKVLLYGAIGAAWTDAEVTVYSSGRNNSGQASFDFDDVGLVLAGGFDYAMTENFRLRVEGSYYLFDDKHNIVDTPGLNADTGDKVELEDVYLFKVGASYKF